MFRIYLKQREVKTPGPPAGSFLSMAPNSLCSLVTIRLTGLGRLL